MNYEKAREFAIRKHWGQKRKMSGKDYVCHPIEVSEKFNDENIKIVAVLHDVLEDTNTTLLELIELGIEGEEIAALELLTKTEGQSYLDYILEINRNYIARLVKIEDLKNNLIDPLSKCQEDKYKMAIYILGAET